MKLFLPIRKHFVLLHLNMEQNEVIKHIKEVGERILPEGASLWLYGSRARGDARPDSDYDLLILLDKDRVTSDDCSRYSYPLYYWGTGIGQEVNAHIYTKQDWQRWRLAPFNENVEREKVVLL